MSLVFVTRNEGQKLSGLSPSVHQVIGLEFPPPHTATEGFLLLRICFSFLLFVHCVRNNKYAARAIVQRTTDFVLSFFLAARIPSPVCPDLSSPSNLT